MRQLKILPKYFIYNYSLFLLFDFTKHTLNDDGSVTLILSMFPESSLNIKNNNTWSIKLNYIIMHFKMFDEIKFKALILSLVTNKIGPSIVISEITLV